MFPRPHKRLAPILLDGLDTLVEIATLGEFGLAKDGRPLALTSGAAPAAGRQWAGADGVAGDLPEARSVGEEWPSGRALGEGVSGSDVTFEGAPAWELRGRRDDCPWRRCAMCRGRPRAHA